MSLNQPDWMPKPSEFIKAPGIAGAYAWMECSLHKLYEEDKLCPGDGQSTASGSGR